MEMFKKQLNEGQAGDNVGLLLRGIKREDVVRGQVVCKPGTIKPYKKFEGELYALNKEEGGRHTPFFSNYKPQFFFRTADVTGGCHVPATPVFPRARPSPLAGPWPFRSLHFLVKAPPSELFNACHDCVSLYQFVLSATSLPPLLVDV